MLDAVVRRAFLALALAAAARAGEADRALLRSSGIESLEAYLKSLVPGERERAEAAEAVRDLGAESPTRRHDALLRIGALQPPPIRELRAALEDPDPDVRRVAARLLDEAIRRARKHLLLAALRTVAEERPPGLAETVLGVAPLAAELHVMPSLEAALRGALREEDLPMLRLAAGAADADTRRAAVRALGAAPGAGPDEAARYLEATDESTRLAAALAFADRGDRRCLAPLGALLDAKSPEVRRGAADALRSTVGGGDGFDPLGAPAARREAALAWRKAIEATPPHRAWDHPLPVGTRHLGRTLLSLFTENRVIELDADGVRTFQADGLQGAWAVQGLPSGHRLVALHQGRAILEYDHSGAEIARIPVPGQPGGFQRLDNGNTLVALTDQNLVVELKPDGSVAAEHATKGQPLDVRLLDNGRLLVCLNGPPQVVEMERTGEVVWSVTSRNAISTAQRLENGNTLVAETSGPGRAVEYDPSGRAVWELTGLRYCYSAERLPNGSTLIADATGVREVAPDGKERWLFKTRAYSRACRY